MLFRFIDSDYKNIILIEDLKIFLFKIKLALSDNEIN